MVAPGTRGPVTVKAFIIVLCIALWFLLTTTLAYHVYTQYLREQVEKKHARTKAAAERAQNKMANAVDDEKKTPNPTLKKNNF